MGGDAEQQQGDRAGEVEGVGRAFEDGVRVAQIGGDEGGGALGGAGEQGVGVGEDGRVVVDVDDPRSRADALGDLVGVVRGGQPGADVEELA